MFIRKTHRTEAIERATVVVANRPAARATNGVTRGQGGRADIADTCERKMLAMDDHIAGEDSADQSAPEHEPCSAEYRARVAHQHCVVELAAEESADDRREHDVAHGFRVVPASGELPLRGDLADDERHEDGETKAGELERADIVRERLVNYGSEDWMHWVEI